MKTAEEMKRERKNVQWSGYGELGNISQKPLQPTAEGAEHDIEAMRKCLHYYVNLIEINHYDALIFGAMRDYADEFATLHAQKIADKMVSEKLREELIKYEIHWNFVLRDNAEKVVDEYLKSRER